MSLVPVPSDPGRAATVVGLVTTVAGVALLAAPERVGRRSWIAEPAQASALGAVDLGIAAGLLLARRRSRWMAARVVATVGTAAFFVRIARDGAPGAPTIGPAAVAVALLGVSVVDVGVVGALRAAERHPDPDAIVVDG
jgi:hypothetical protein